MGAGIGIIGADGDPKNVVYAAVLLVGIGGALIARLQAAGMARTLVAMAVTQAVIALVSVVAGWGMPYSPPAELLIFNGGFIGLFLGSAWLFQRSARGSQGPSDQADKSPQVART